MNSEYKLDSKKFLKVSIWNFDIFGIDIQIPEDGKIIKNPYKMLYNVLIGLLCSFMLVHYAVIHRDNMLKVSQGLCIFTPWILSWLKTLIFLLKAQDHIQLIRRFDALGAYAQANKNYRNIWLMENQRSLYYSSMLWYFCYAGITVQFISPGLNMLITYLNSGKLILEPPYWGMYYFYDYRHPILYAGSCIIWLLFLWSIAHGTLHVDSLLIWYIQNLSAHYNILDNKFKMAAEELRRENISFKFHEKLVDAVNYHCCILNLVKHINRAHSFISLSEVIISCFQLCLFVYQAQRGPEYYQLPVISLALIGLSLQIMVYCFGGQQLQNMSERLSESIYLLFPWENMKPAEKRMLLIPMIRAQRNNELKAHIFVVNNKLLLLVFRAAFSISALITALNEKLIEY